MQRMNHPGGRMPGPMNPVSCGCFTHGFCDCSIALLRGAGHLVEQ